MIERLKEEIIKKYGSDLQYTKDCKILAQEVYDHTGEMLSTTTVRRMFGFLKSTSSPSKFTLNVLARYIGHESWDKFVAEIDGELFQSQGLAEKWNSLYERSLQLSQYTFNLIADQSGIPFDAVVPREFAERRIDEFLESESIATSFVAPGGYGKSTMLAKWFEGRWLKQKNEDLVFFLNANFLINFLNNDFKLDRWLHDQLGYANENVFNFFLEHPHECLGRIVIVIDALDEITYDLIKLERLFLQLTAFISNYRSSDKIKLIITSRNSTWEKFAYPLLNSGIAQKEIWYNLSTDYISADKTNMQPLNEEEIQQVINATINKQFKPRLLCEEMSFPLKQTVSYPYFLELFIKLYDPNSLNNLNEGIDLIDDFLKKKIYYSRFSDEKIDILSGIIQLQDLGRNGNAIKKNELKQLYPIHLKSAGNYYFAYEEMLSYGIISEVLMDNRFGSYTKYVQISHQFLFEMLVVRNLMEENEGVDFDLFKTIEREFTGFECKNRMIGLLYGFAYREGNFESLKDFFLLNDNTLSDPYLMEMIGRNFRNLDEFGRKLLSHFAGQERACIYLFEKFVDLNYLMGSYRQVVEEFMHKQERKSIAITCAGLLLYAAIYSMKQEEARHYYDFLIENKPDTKCSVYAIAIRLSAIMLYNLYYSGESNEEYLLKLFYYREMAYSTADNYLEFGDGEFELIICNALLQMKAFHKILQLVEDAERYNYKCQREGVVSGNYLALQTYKLYAQFSLGVELDEERVEFLKFHKAELSPERGFVIRIVYNSFMADYYFRKGNLQKAHECLDKAVEISEFANYDLVTAGLLGKMAMYYSELHEDKKERICMKERDIILGGLKGLIKTEGIVV